MHTLFSNISSALRKAGHRPVDLLIACVFVGYVCFVVWQLSLGIDFDKVILLGIFSYFMLRIFYEFTLNRKNIPTLATGFFEIRKIAKILKQDFKNKAKPDYRVVDCGSGKGQMTRTIANAIPAAHVLGIELSPWPYKQSLFFKRIMGIKNVEYVQKDFFAHDYTCADAVILFLNGPITQSLGVKLYAELKSGALVITNEFELLGNWPPPEHITMYTPFKGNLYIYRR